MRLGSVAGAKAVLSTCNVALDVAHVAQPVLTTITQNNIALIFLKAPSLCVDASRYSHFQKSDVRVAATSRYIRLSSFFSATSSRSSAAVGRACPSALAMLVRTPAGVRSGRFGVVTDS